MQKTGEKTITQKPQRTVALQSNGSFFARAAGVASSVLSCAVLIGVVLAVVECGFALAHVGEDVYMKPDPLLGTTHIESQKLVYRNEGYSQSQTNSFGFREREFSLQKTPGTTRVCVLGDSMTVGLEVQPAMTFSRLLENRLNDAGKGKFEVLNCGQSGYGTGQEYLVYRQKVQQLNPDLVILIYNVGDAEDNVFQRSGMNPPRPIFRVGNGKLTTELTEVNKWFMTNDARFYSSFDWLRRHSRILAVLNKMNTDLNSSSSTYRSVVKTIGQPAAFVWDRLLSLLPVPARPDFDPGLISVDLGAAPIIDNDSTGAAALINSPVVLNPATQELRYAFAATKSKTEVSLGIIRALNNECKMHGCKLAVVAGPALTNSIFYYRELDQMRKAAGKEGYYFIDSTQVFPPRQPMESSPYFFGLHFTRSGHKLMTNVIYNGLQDAWLAAK